MPIAHKGVTPRLHPTVFVAEGARIVGDVEIGEDSSVWFNAVIRGDILPVRIGRRTNVQDGCILHTKEGFPEPVYYGVHGGIKDFYKVEPEKEHAATLDHIVGAVSA